MHRALLMAVAMLLLVACAMAQTSTGRHRTERPPAATDQENQGDGGADGWTYFVSAGAGLATGGDVARIRTADVSGILWDPAGGTSFASHNILLTLDENLGLAVGMGRRLSRAFWLRVDGSASTLDLAAEARVGEGMEVYLWDRLSVAMATAALEYRLTDQPSFPYLVAGAGLMVVSGESDDQFDQTRPTVRLGAGYEQRFMAPWSFRVEIRDSITDLDLEDYVPPVEGNLVPDYSLENKGPTHVFELLLTLTGAF